MSLIYGSDFRARLWGESRLEYTRWAPRYEEIRSAFDFPFEREEESARRLSQLLPEPAHAEALDRIAGRLAGRTAIVVGRAPRQGAPPVWQLPAETPPPVLLAADGATVRCLDAGLVPDLVITDLDGPVASEFNANARGALAVIHAHGDNQAMLECCVPEFRGELAGSWAGPPRDGLIDVGGFTDGDRAVYLAEHVGARRVLLWGFDFEHPAASRGASPERKLEKLKWAKRLIEELASVSSTPIVQWASDGTFQRYGGKVEASTQ
jgi:2-amino-4-hydroxy-6-hydroxymethyldihydropteridine diphosphokinase